MKKLDRSSAQTPQCLSTLSHETHTWKDMNIGNRKAQVWTEIDKFQEQFCVYCESRAFKGRTTGHIEHFFHKGSPQYESLMFDWNNLFGCCVSNKHCGHYKDRILTGGVKREYDATLLLKPDIDDPEEYFQFLPSGSVKVRDGLPPDKENKGKETIKALNLNSPELKISRKSQITLYQNRLLTFAEMIGALTDEGIDEYFDIQDEAKNVPHRTAIKQAISWL